MSQITRRSRLLKCKLQTFHKREICQFLIIILKFYLSLKTIWMMAGSFFTVLLVNILNFLNIFQEIIESISIIFHYYSL